MLDYIARRLISTQAVRDSKDRYAALGRPSRRGNDRAIIMVLAAACMLLR